MKAAKFEARKPPQRSDTGGAGPLLSKSVTIFEAAGFSRRFAYVPSTCAVNEALPYLSRLDLPLRGAGNFRRCQKGVRHIGLFDAAKRVGKEMET